MKYKKCLAVKVYNKIKFLGFIFLVLFQIVALFIIISMDGFTLLKAVLYILIILIPQIIVIFLPFFAYKKLKKENEKISTKIITNIYSLYIVDIDSNCSNAFFLSDYQNIMVRLYKFNILIYINLKKNIIVTNSQTKLNLEFLNQMFNKFIVYGNVHYNNSKIRIRISYPKFNQLFNKSENEIERVLVDEFIIIGSKLNELNLLP